MKYPSIQLALMSYAGLNEYTAECAHFESMHAARIGCLLDYQRISNDALIPRSRSRALGKFLNKNESDVMVMIDHDIQWNVGDVLELAKVAAEACTIVGGLYCKRTFHRGWSSRVIHNGSIGFGQPGVMDVESVATGFLAIPRIVAKNMVAKLNVDGDIYKSLQQQVLDSGKLDDFLTLHDMSIGRIQDGAYRNSTEHDYYDFFRCFRRKLGDGVYEFLSEDWAFCARARFCGHRPYISTEPKLIHWGDYGFRLADGMDNIDANSKEQNED